MNRSVVAATIAGLIAGVLGSVAANSWFSSKSRSEQVPGVPLLADGDPNPSAHSRSEVSKGMLAALALAAAKGKGQANVPPPPLPERQKSLREFNDALAIHMREPDSPAWAARTKQGLTADLRGLSAKAGFSAFEVDCRSKTCAGFIEWPSPAAATQNLSEILHNEYKINSSVRVALPADLPDGPCRVSVIFEPAPGT